MILNLLKLLKNAFVDDYNIHVIMTTHSPTTIALAEDDDLYYMQHDNNNRLVKSSKDRILKELAYGIPSLSVTYRNRRNVIVESEKDAKWLERLYRVCLKNELLPFEISLNFIASGTSKTPNSGNCDNVKNIVKAFNDLSTVIGLIDKDKRGINTPEGISILTGGERYSLENLLLDPVWVVRFFRSNTSFGIFQSSKYGFSQCDGDIQREVNVFFGLIRSTLTIDAADAATVSVKYTDGSIVEMPQWYLSYNGHNLAEAIKAVFLELNKTCKHEDDLYNQILGCLELNYQSCPTSIVETFKVLAQ
jgi:hypothetical protein